MWCSLAAQQAAVERRARLAACEDVDAVARAMIAEAGLGEYFIHRTGHGIGIEEHEDPYMVAGNSTPLAAGHAFSIEPGIYLPGPLRRRASRTSWWWARTAPSPSTRWTTALSRPTWVS